MKALILFVGWCILFVLCWPLALLALILFPVVWLLTLPFRLIGITFEALLALVRASYCSRRGFWDGVAPPSRPEEIAPDGRMAPVWSWQVFGRERTQSGAQSPQLA